MPSDLTPKNTLLLVCDIQTRFQNAIHGFDDMVNTSIRMVKFAKILGLHVLASEQNPKALGTTVTNISELFQDLGDLYLGTYEKTRFSMRVPEIVSILEQNDFRNLILVGIESHVCVLQSALDFLSDDFNVYVLADGVSSCNKEEIPFALARMRQAGAQITTSESLSFQLMGDSVNPDFRTFSALVKDEKDRIRTSLTTLAGNSILKSAL